MLSHEFIHWLDGYLDSGDFEHGMSEAHTDRIRAKLNNVFRHEIDPEQDAGRDAGALRQVHDGIPATGFDFDEPEGDMC